MGGFDLYFPNDKMLLNIFHMSTVHLNVLFEEMYSDSLCSL